MLSPEAICQQIRAALEHEPRINLHRSPIHLRYDDGIVTVDGDAEHIVAKKLALERAAAMPGVDGLVPNTTIRKMAEFDVWYVFSIDRVVNELQVHA